ESEVQADVAEAMSKVVLARMTYRLVHESVLPLRDKQLDLSQRQFNAMLLGRYQLLDARQKQAEAQRQAIESLRDFWVATVELEHAVGGSLPALRPSTQPATKPAATEPADHMHHHHGD